MRQPARRLASGPDLHLLPRDARVPVPAADPAAAPAAKRHQEMLENLSIGDEVVTAGGIYGEVTGIDDERVQLEVDADVRIAVSTAGRSPTRCRPRSPPAMADEARGGPRARRGARAGRTPTTFEDPRARCRGSRRAAEAVTRPTVRRYLLDPPRPLSSRSLGVLTLGYFREPTLGLDLQGGLEVVLAGAARGRAGADRRRTSTGRSRSSATASTRSASPSPRSASRSRTRSSSTSPASSTPPRAAALIGQTAQLEFYDLQGDVDPLSQDANGNPVPSATLLRS